MEDSKPTVIGNYEILERVGRGGVGCVFKARHIETHEIVALKLLHEHYQKDRRLLGLFHKEIMIQAQVSHRNCVRFIEANLTTDPAHIVTTFVDGYNCFNLVRDFGAVPPIISVCIVFDVLQGLEHLHCMDILHSDLTPSNVMLSRTGLVMVMDFGLSLFKEVENYDGVIAGTPGYLSPERLVRGPVTAVTDIYSVGIILWELLRGARLFYGIQSPVDLKKAMKRPDVNWLATGDKDLDRALRHILRKSLAWKPADRFQSPKDFMWDLYQCLKRFGVRHTRRAILHWMHDYNLTDEAVAAPQQRIYVNPKVRR